MIFLLTVLITAAATHKVVDSNEDLSPDHFNTTLLHPIANKTEDKTSSASTWKIATSLAEAKADNGTSKEESKESPETTTAKPDNNTSPEFKPSPLVGTFLSEDNFVVPTSQSYPPFAPVIRRPPAGFFSSHKEERYHHQHPLNKIPQEVFKHYQFPYKIETPILKPKDDWKPNFLDTKPTVETLDKVPAGGLYKSPDPFGDKPGDFGLDFHGDLREVAFKKRVNPMTGVMRLLTALIPVGIIVSALTPSVITLESTANNINGNGISNNGISNNGGINNHIGIHKYDNSFRRADVSSQQPPAISERCRRRLLCELKRDELYQRSTGGGCRRIRCEDPAALQETLRWLLSRPASAGPIRH